MNLLIFLVIPGILSFFLMKKEKANVHEGQKDESPLGGSLLWFVFILELFAPLVAQAVFYYGWKKQLPKKAAKANSLGWIAILVLIGINILLNSIA